MFNTYTVSTADFETINDFLRFGLSEANKAELFYGHGTDNAYDDIRALILGTLSLPWDINKSLLKARLTPEEKQSLQQQLFQRIKNKIPVPYLTRESFFCGLSFYVDERVLIPRSPIAELIDRQFFPWLEPDAVHHILDLCTGSACIAIACGYAFPDAAVDAADISPHALEVAAINCKRHGLEDSLRLIESDCWEKIPSLRYDLIVSNPPYVGDAEMASLPDEYQHEPVMALRAEKDGLALVEKILAQAHEYLTDQGILVVEVGNSEQALVDAYPELPFTWLEFEQGGQGVFLLTCEQLRAWHER